MDVAVGEVVYYTYCSSGAPNSRTQTNIHTRPKLTDAERQTEGKSDYFYTYQVPDTRYSSTYVEAACRFYWTVLVAMLYTGKINNC